jgi:L-ascorbate metabolism protein UlaG (beta-lactamase superfamily)
MTSTSISVSSVMALPATVVSAQHTPFVSMTRPEEVLATHYTSYGHGSTFVELEGGRILHAAHTTFTASGYGGITWSKPFKNTNVQGNPVGAGLHQIHEFPFSP